jgi:hypothetical protein
MALKTRRANERDADRKPDHAGDILGISDADPQVGIDAPVTRGSGHPKGIDVREPASGIGDVHRGSGATGIDMGGAGEGTDIDQDSSRPHSAENQEE